MTLQMPTDPKERKVVEDFIEFKRSPYVTMTERAGWNLYLFEEWGMGDDTWRFEWIAAHTATGRFISFSTEDDEPEACYEAAAEQLVSLTVENPVLP